MTERTSSTITINAPRADIMTVIADFPSYPEWAGAVRTVEVLDTEASGRASRVRFALDAGVLKDTYVLGYSWENDSAVRWGLVEQGQVLSDMNGSYQLAEQGTGGGSGEGATASTEVTYELAVDVKIPMIGMFKRKAEKVIIDTALKELKKRVEC